MLRDGKEIDPWKPWREETKSSWQATPPKRMSFFSFSSGDDFSLTCKTAKENEIRRKASHDDDVRKKRKKIPTRFETTNL